MKGLSVKTRVALMCALLAALVAALSAAALLRADRLMVEHYYSNLLASTAFLAQDELAYSEDGLEIDPNLDRQPEVKLAVFDESGALLYGRVLYDAPFEEAAFRHARDRDGELWYGYDRLLDLDGGEDVWLRCSVHADMADFRSGTRLHELLLPGALLLVLAGLGGHFIARRAFRPVSRMAAVAGEIADGEDLKKRVPLSGPRDEIHRLGEVLNSMLARLEAAFDREKRFSADAAHELRTPVAAVLSQSEYALSAAADDADRLAALSQIHRRAEDMADLIRRLLLLARLESGQVVPEAERMELGPLCEMAAEALRPQADARKIALRVACEADASVAGDPAMLTHAVMNLVENGIKYGRAGGFVRLEVNAGGGEALLAVEDDGCGMSEAQRAHIFERFYQADASHRASGVGLGLPLCARIVALHGGRIEVQSAPGKGSRFSVWLPLAQAGADETEGRMDP